MNIAIHTGMEWVRAIPTSMLISMSMDIPTQNPVAMSINTQMTTGHISISI
jgi:hypothetical protein